MEQFLDKEVFKKNIEKLIIAFNYNTTKEQMALYYKYLKNSFTDNDFELACFSIILDERFFPAISVFLTHKPQPLWKKAF